ncbi:hypothetical protein [Alicyclobacillus dauci]|uniref:Uncharacterized protein n=1 Tax=Alicyclobacillus dauci TaxID=1475485 RepID=A0ABY6Z1G4_9BACL|nr:hypothetical protein [Alicyclobacillus dauci]WAH36724.1 hypothetical protein NZD86_21535 [Alicyclobacillus dauci]
MSSPFADFGKVVGACAPLRVFVGTWLIALRTISGNDALLWVAEFDDSELPVASLADPAPLVAPTEFAVFDAELLLVALVLYKGAVGASDLWAHPASPTMLMVATAVLVTIFV